METHKNQITSFLVYHATRYNIEGRHVREERATCAMSLLFSLLNLLAAAAPGDILRTKDLTPEQFGVHVMTGVPIVIENADRGLPLEGEVCTCLAFCVTCSSMCHAFSRTANLCRIGLATQRCAGSMTGSELPRLDPVSLSLLN